MARAEAASASLRPDSIQGLAKSIAKPAYRRLLSAEPLLRRAVPVLIIAFLITICVGAAVQVLEQRRQATVEARRAIEALADNLALEFDRPARNAKGKFRPHFGGDRACAAGMGSERRPRRSLSPTPTAAIIATMPNDPRQIGRALIDLLGPSQPLTTFGAAAGTLEITLPDGAAAFATVRALRNPLGIVAVDRNRERARLPVGVRAPRSPSRCRPRPASWC